MRKQSFPQMVLIENDKSNLLVSSTNDDEATRIRLETKMNEMKARFQLLYVDETFEPDQIDIKVEDNNQNSDLVPLVSKQNEKLSPAQRWGRLKQVINVSKPKLETFESSNDSELKPEISSKSNNYLEDFGFLNSAMDVEFPLEQPTVLAESKSDASVKRDIPVLLDEISMLEILADCAVPKPLIEDVLVVNPLLDDKMNFATSQLNVFQATASVSEVEVKKIPQQTIDEYNQQLKASLLRRKMLQAEEYKNRDIRQLLKQNEIFNEAQTKNNFHIAQTTNERQKLLQEKNSIRKVTRNIYTRLREELETFLAERHSTFSEIFGEINTNKRQSLSRSFHIQSKSAPQPIEVQH
jgi:hypothetical protein